MELNDEIYQCDWYLFPYHIQRMLPMILINTQQRVVLQGFGNIVFLRETFKEVI